METLSMIFYFLVVFGVLVNIHELGHFLAARASGMRVDIFSFGMGNRLFGWNKKYGFTFGKISDDFEKEGITDYRVSLFPIGGYVKIAGMIDESNDTEFLNKEPQPWEFRSKNAFLKAMTISAGVIMNALLAVAFFAIIALSIGKTYHETTTIAHVDKNTIADYCNLLPGDRVISIDGKETRYWEEMIKDLTVHDLGANKTVKVERQGQIIEVVTDGEKTVKSIADSKFFGLNPAGSSVFFDQVETLRPADKAGLKPGDTVLAMNSEKIYSVAQFKDLVKSNKERYMPIEYKRGESIIKDSIKPDADGMIGVVLAQSYDVPAKVIEYSLLEAVAYGFEESYRSLELFYNSMAQIFNGTIEAKQALGGPIMIAKQAARQAEGGILALMNFTALISLTLAVINILPLPALDGGHLVFIIIEAIIRREIPAKAKMIITQTGFILLLALMAYVVYLDLTR